MPDHMVKDRHGKWHNAVGAIVLLSGQTYVVKTEGDYAGHYILESVWVALGRAFLLSQFSFSWCALGCYGVLGSL